MEESALVGQRARAASRTPGRAAVSSLGLALIAFGALASAGAATLVLASAGGAARSTEAELEQVPADAIDASVPSLYRNVAVRMIADARSCKAPLAMLTVAAGGTSDGYTLRIRSGPYLSPPFRISGTPQRIAIPYPAAYAAGQGAISVVGLARNVTIRLSPAWVLPDLSGTAERQVTWRPKPNC